QTILTVFNWTEKPRTHHIPLAALDLSSQDQYVVSNALDGGDALRIVDAAIEIAQPAHSVRVLKIIDKNFAARPPMPTVEHASHSMAGMPLAFSAASDNSIVRYDWDFGDGINLGGRNVTHTYTHAGDFTVTLRATGVGGVIGKQKFPLSINGRIPTKFVPSQKIRYKPNEN
ncbi:MAG: PKD domain-containing protein, partial [Abditibacteriaceae bacterium]